MKILILGTRTLAEQVADLVTEIDGCEVAGFVENMSRERCNDTLRGYPIYWVDDIADLSKTHKCMCALSTTHRSTYIEQVKALGMSFATLIHPLSHVSKTAEIAEGCFVSPLANVASYAVLGSHCYVNRGALIGHHTSIGSFCSIQPGANIAGAVSIGESTYVGIGSVVIDKISIGSHCVIGAGAVVVKDLPDRVQALGVPARIVKTEIEGK